jgi:hypothetical protein
MEEEKKTGAIAPAPNPAAGGTDDGVSESDLEDGKKPNPSGTPNSGDNEPDKAAAGTGDGTPAPKQSREDDAKNAERRRREKAKADQEKQEHDEEIRKQAEFDVKKSQVTDGELKDLGIEQVKDPNDLYLVECYRKAKAEGKENPLAEAYRQQAKKLRDDKAAEEASAKAQADQLEEERQIVATEQGEIKKKYGKTTGEILRDEPDFKEFFDQYGKPGTFDECYSTFHKIRGGSESKAKADGIPPTSGTGKGDGGSSKETDEQFIARTKAKYGNDF